MNLDIAGRKAIVCASSQGLGLACAEALAMEGVEVFINGRHDGKLNETAERLRARTGATVQAIVGDITSEEGRAALLRACPEPDILVNNNAGPPPGRLEDWTPAVWQSVLDANMLSGIFLTQAVLRGMQQRKWGRIVNITSAMVKSPRPHMALSCAARAGFTAFSKALSFEVAKDNVTINQLLPERIDSPRQIQMTERTMKVDGLTWDEAREKISASISAKRFGTMQEFGEACAFLCGSNAGFISGQNLQLDGGSSPSLL